MCSLAKLAGCNQHVHLTATPWVSELRTHLQPILHMHAIRDPGVTCGSGSLTGQALAGNLLGVRQALAAGASINYQDERGFTPLCAAYVHRHVHVLRLLLDSGADPVVRVPVVEEQNTTREESTTSGGLLRYCRPCRDVRDDNDDDEEVEVAAEEDCCYLCRRNGRDMIGYMNGDMSSSSRHFNGSTCAECENKLRCHEPGCACKDLRSTPLTLTMTATSIEVRVHGDAPKHLLEILEILEMNEAGPPQELPIGGSYGPDGHLAAVKGAPELEDVDEQEHLQLPDELAGIESFIDAVLHCDGAVVVA